MVDASGAVGTLIQLTRMVPQQPCPDGEIWNPSTKRCVSRKSREGLTIAAVLGEELPTEEGKVRNPATGKLVSIKKGTAAKILGQNSCAQYGGLRTPFIPRPSQLALRDYFTTSGKQGVLLYWSLGAGKTCGSIILLDTLLEMNPSIQNVYILTAGALRENYLMQYCTSCGGKNNAKFKFVTYNYTKVDDKMPTPEEMSNSIIVVDEIHNVINGYKNESPTYVHVYNTLAETTCSRFILLSGTPITKDYDDIYYLTYLLDPGMFSSVDELTTIFERKDVATLRSRLQTVISRVAISEDPSKYPTVTHINKEIPMSENQVTEYFAARGKELLFLPDETMKEYDPSGYKEARTRFYISYAMIRSRQKCNMHYGQYDSDKDLDDAFIEDMDYYSPKFKSIIDTVVSTPGKHVIYSEFKNGYGIYALARILSMMDIPYLTFTGEMNDTKRRETTESFNHLNNINGSKYKVLLMTEAGAEGQNFLQVRTMHIVEQSIDEMNIKQVMGRCVRYMSHDALPQVDRTITIIRYFSTVYGEDDPDKRKTSDHMAYAVGQKRMSRIGPMMEILDTLDVVPGI